MKSLRLLIALLFPIAFFSQNGPGGVGSSASNVMWLDANRGVSLSSGKVTNWADQSGNGFNAVPSSASAQPSLVTGSANGFPSLKFDGTDDELWVSDNPALSLTQWNFFIVPKVNTQKDYNAWLTKGNDASENFEMLCYGDAHFHTPILFTDGNRGFLDANAVLATTTEFNIFEYSYSASTGRRVYKNYSASTASDAENRTPATNNFSLYIGNEKATTGRFINANLAEVIMYNAPLNSAQRIIVNNYLAAKYNCTLTTNDVYSMDTPANGNFDYEVAGIGRVDVSNIQSDSKGSGMIRILNPTGLGDNEFYMWGHNNGTLGAFGNSDFPVGLQGRLGRIWRGSQTGTITSFDVQFDLSGLGSIVASQLRLLIDKNNDGLFIDETVAGGGILSSASLVSGSIYQFTGITGLTNNLRFTVGTTSISSTPLPVTLLSFKAVYNAGVTSLSWSTASEKNSSHFSVERSKDGINFETIAVVKAAGNSSQKLDYTAEDAQPLQGLMYYRLSESDLDGTISHSNIVAVSADQAQENMLVFPNPTDGIFTIDVKIADREDLKLFISNSRGKRCFSASFAGSPEQHLYPIDTQDKLSAGSYVVTLVSKSRTYSQILIIR